MLVTIVKLFDTKTIDFSSKSRVSKCKNVLLSKREKRVGQNHMCSCISISSLVSGKAYITSLGSVSNYMVKVLALISYLLLGN